MLTHRLHEADLLAVLAIGVILAANSDCAVGQSWELTAKVIPDDCDQDDLFGSSVAVSNQLVVIGSPMDEGNGQYSGSVSVYDAFSAQRILRLALSNGGDYDDFGESVAIENDIIVVGVPGRYVTGKHSGAVYLFNALSGEQIGSLEPDDGEPFALFGRSVAIDDGRIAVGEPIDFTYGGDPGSAYIFDTHSGEQLWHLLSDDGNRRDQFGYAVDIEDGIIAVGAVHHIHNGIESGAAYLFDAVTGVQLAELLPSDGQDNDRFGSSIAIADGLVAVGAPLHVEPGMLSGAVYVFDIVSGNQVAYVYPTDDQDYSAFGTSVDMDSGLLAIGADGGDRNGHKAGAAYVYDLQTGERIERLLPVGDPYRGDFGRAIAVAGNGTIAVGAPQDWTNGPYAGAAYLYSMVRCLSLDVANLIGGQNATFTITGGTPGEEAVAVYGFKTGETVVNDVHGVCATFGIEGVDLSRVIGGRNLVFDADGVVSFEVPVPGDASGRTVYFQAAQRGTCPGECVSNVVGQVVE